MSWIALSFLVGLAVGIAGTVEAEGLWDKLKAKIKKDG